MVLIHFRNGKSINVSNDYSQLYNFIENDTGKSINLINSANEDYKYLVRKEAIDYIEYYDPK
ncbi:MAG: hypothetical protein ACI35O_14740 [Bacillaceae bacterium]